MASNPFEVMGIKEVADVTFYELSSGAPVLYLDTLKVSTLDTTAEQVSATGGKGNSPLVIWDFGREITLTLEDALFSMKSMAIMNGGKMGKTEKVDRATSFTPDVDGAIPEGKIADIPTDAKYYDSLGKETVIANVLKGMTYIASWQEVVEGGADTITISAEAFPGTYKVVGLTYARDTEGTDEFFQFVIPRAKVGAENSITMQAEGDPSTFSMTLTVMRPSDGNMLKLLKFPKKETAPIIDVTGITLDKTSLNLLPTNQEQVTATVMPLDATNKEVIWSSADSAIATVDPTGLITAVADGNVNIIATTVDGGYSATCALAVGAAIIPATGVVLNKTSATIKEGLTDSLTATVMPATATNKNVTWSSSDEAIATVANGVVTGVAAGNATITVTTEDGGFEATASITVEGLIKVTGVTLDVETADVAVGTDITLTATVDPTDAEDKSVIWTTSDEAIATVIDGVVTGVAEGNANIIVTTNDGNFSDTAAITVTV